VSLDFVQERSRAVIEVETNMRDALRMAACISRSCGSAAADGGGLQRLQ
jgi:hypothetical protein